MEHLNTSDLIAEAVASALKTAGVDMKREDQSNLSLALSIAEVAQILGVSKTTAYQIARQKGFPAFQIGKRTLVSRKGLQDWVDEQCRKGAGL